MIVGSEVYPEERGELAADLVQRAFISEKCCGQTLVLHSDNGAPMKSSTLLAKPRRTSKSKEKNVAWSLETN